VKKNKNKPSMVILRDVSEDDFPWFFEQQLDPDANHMAAFNSKDPHDRNAFMEKWSRILRDNQISKRTIVFEGQIAGHIARFERFGDQEVTYWIGKEFWGKGITTRALEQFLLAEKNRPLYARAAKDNIASIRVLEKCGFSITGIEKVFADGRGEEIEELILILE
jgi:RimJ/RimL family protein N-acetyltransferase